MALYIIIVVFIISTFLPVTRNPHWFFRTSDFIRVQTFLLQGVLLLLFIYSEKEFSTFSWVILFSLLATMIYQIFKIFPYTSFFPTRKPISKSSGKVSILAGNVLQTNSRYTDFVKEIKHFDPDLVLVMESDKEWEDGLSEIEVTYPHNVKVALENFYGMHLYSKIALENVEVKYQIEDDKPSIFFDYPLHGNASIHFCCLHPAPPSPTENETSKERDAELMLTGKRIRTLDQPTVVCGDMNDVVWSRTTRLFKKMTGMVDPRIGRGFFSTYNANYFFLRFPLDHLFHTKDLYVGKMQRSKYFGSDHYAMYYEIHHKKNKPTPKNPKLNSDEKAEIAELIYEGKENQDT